MKLQPNRWSRRNETNGRVYVINLCLPTLGFDLKSIGKKMCIFLVLGGNFSPQFFRLMGVEDLDSFVTQIHEVRASGKANANRAG